MKQPNGASFEFFEKLLPPLRYVNADFRYYPIVLSAPNAKVKARLISNGSGVNLKGGSRAWNDNGTAVRFRVGPDEFLFGGWLDRVTHPTLAEGWLPITEIRYFHPSPLQAGGNVPLAQPKPEVAPEIYVLEAFAATDPALASNGVVFVKFQLAQGTNGHVAVEVDGRPPLDAEPAKLMDEQGKPLDEPLQGPPLKPSAARMEFKQGKVLDDKGRALLLCDPTWKWDRQLATAHLTPGMSATLAIATRPIGGPSAPALDNFTYAKQRELCIQTWREVLGEGMNVETPEPYANNAWRHLICQNFELINGNSMRYSQGNQYDKLYESEGSDAALAMLVWGYEKDMRRLLVPLLDFTRKGLEFHQAGFKLLDVCRYYWQSRDPAVISELRTRWLKEALRLAGNRTPENGLYPKEQYCGDIYTFVYSLNANAKAWRALRDLSAILAEGGDATEARQYADNAAAFRKLILDALQKNIRRETTPPFVPVALFSDEPVHDPIVNSRIGGYWNIIIGYTIASGIFPPGSEEETWIPHYQEQHGGLCMGMLRAGGGYTFWTSANRFNPLYGTRYALDTLRRDDPERALISFYGMLAQGFTRNTFISGEGCSFTPVDEGGRLLYCPPNSAANAHFLSMFRYLLVQDWDLDDDGKPETLRLLFATPKRWLEDGKTINVERAPTAFGPVSMRVESKLSQGEVVADLDLPERNAPKHTLVRIRVPDGWKVVSAKAGAQDLKVDAQGTADITELKGKASLRFHVTR
jgi:hypothetical protein